MSENLKIDESFEESAQSSGSIHLYEFSDFEQNSPSFDGKVEEYEIQDLGQYKERQKKLNEPIIKKERIHMEDNQFSVSPVVDHFRGLQEQAAREREERFQRELEERFAKVKEQAYQEGFEKGQKEGFEKIQNELAQEATDKVQMLENYIQAIHEERLELLKAEKTNIYELVKTLTKWVILRELEDDGAYLERLLEKLILEIQSKSNLLLKVDKEYFSAMPEVCEIVEQKLGELQNTRVEVLQRTQNDKEKGLILECDNGIIDGTLATQFETLEKLFSNLDVYDN